MSRINVLDCTLRDGAYLIDKKFGLENISGITRGLIDSDIDFVEVGFFQDDGFGEGKTVYKNSKEASKYLPAKKKKSQYTVLADCSRYSIENLDDRQEGIIDCIRECFFKIEISQAIENCKVIREKGYKVFVQPVDILGYSDYELLDLIEKVNAIEPFCFSIVDTFGSMYQEDLQRIFELINHNLVKTCKIGFHSHNNMQLSNALSQEFIRMSLGKRDIVIDGTLSGMGRGAGNTPTELIVQYINTKYMGKYNMDSILDIIDIYMDNIRTKCSWGYSTDYFIAGCYGAHVNNISYLNKKHSISSKNMRYILNKIDDKARKRYDYELLDKIFMEMIDEDIDDFVSLKKLKDLLKGKRILIIVPGQSILQNKNKIKEYVKNNDVVVISLNFNPDFITSDYVFVSNQGRVKNIKNRSGERRIYSSNIDKEYIEEADYIVSFKKLVKCGWKLMDNSALMLLRLLDEINCKEIIFAGFDGYSSLHTNYIDSDMEIESASMNCNERNTEIAAMLRDYMETRKNKKTGIRFITKSRFERCLLN